MLLGSSRFSGENLEKFLYCIPNMAQMFINIKEEEEDSDYTDYKVVAGHCIANNPGITWRTLINVLLDGNLIDIALAFLHYLQFSGQQYADEQDKFIIKLSP